MARIRSVKPTIRTSRVVAAWPREVRYFFMLLWGELDDEGRGLDVPKTIAGNCFPYDDDVPPAKVNRWLNMMASTKVAPDREPPICRYEVDGQRLIHCVNWDEHQHPSRPTPSVLPPCPVHERLSESGSEPPPDSHGGITEPPSSPQVLEVDSRKLTDGSCVPSSTGTPLALVRPEPADTTQALIGEWIDHCPKRPPGSVVGQVGKQIKAMLAEGIDPADVRAGFIAWWRKGLHPSTLPSVVNELMNAAPAAVARALPKPSTTDQRVNAALDVGRRLQAQADAVARGEITA